MTQTRRLHSKEDQTGEREHRRRLVSLSKQKGLFHVNWLNEGSSKARTRTARLIELLQSAENQSRKALSSDSLERGELYSQLGATEVEINEILARYRGYRRIFFDPHQDGLPIEIFWNERVLSDSSYAAEEMLVSFALSLLQRGLIQRLRKCRECGKWFYATTEHQTSCSLNCRQRFASHSPEFKRKRAAAQRKRRKNEREAEKRSWEILEQDSRKGRKNQ